MTANTLLASEFKSENLVVSKFQPNKDSGTGTVKLSYKYNENEPAEKLVIQTARMKVPFGIGNDEKFKQKEGDKLKWSIQMSFDGEEKNRKMQKFRKCLEQFDSHIMKVGLKNAEEWINDDEPDEKSVKKSYTAALKRFKPKKDKPDVIYSDTFKISIPWNHEQDSPYENVEFYDESGNLCEWTELVPGCEIVALFSINGIWCSPGINKFGPSIKLVQCQIFKPKKIKGFNIKYDRDSDDEESDDEDIESDDDIEENSGVDSEVEEGESEADE